MKKLIYLFAFIGLFFIAMGNANAQLSYDVRYFDEECSCGSITSKTVEYCIYDIAIQDFIVPCTTITLPASNPFTLSGSESINYDAQNRYIITARVTFYNSLGKCCGGTASKTLDGDELYNGLETLDVYML